MPRPTNCPCEACRLHREDKPFGAPDCVYVQQGYKTRKDYLISMASDYGIDQDTVMQVADLLGPMEDFDGLLTTLEDHGPDN